MPTEVGTAYISVLPSARGFGQSLSRQVAGEVTTAGKTTGKRFGSGMLASVKSLAGPIAGVLAVSKGADFLKDSIAEARDAQKVGAQTAAVLKSTGGAANISAKQIGNLANAISQKAGVDDEAIQSGENLLLTFRNVRNEQGKGNDVFNRATRVITDVSAAMGQSLKSSAVQVGKALNDPVKGMSALQRIGVTFTDKQKNTVKRLVETGHAMDAQKVILKELNTEFRGSAAAQATPAEKAAVAWGNFKELLGTALLPVIDKLLTTLTNRIIPAMTKFVNQIQNGTGAGGQFRDVVVKIASAVANTVGWIVKHRNALAALAAVVVTAVAAYKAFMIVNTVITAVKGAIVYYKAWKATTVAVTGAQEALDGVLIANPIGLVVAAVAGLVVGLVIAYKKSETFRKIVQGAWHGIQAAVGFAWNKVIHPALNAMVDFVNNKVIPVIRFLWVNVVKPYFRLVGNYISFTWNKVIQPLFHAWWAYLHNVLFPVLRFLWNNVVKPVFTGVGKTIRGVWNNVIQPVFKALKTGVNDVRGAFHSAVDGIANVWNTLRSIASKPVGFVVNTVFAGLANAVNKILPGSPLPVPHFDSSGGTSIPSGGGSGGGRKKASGGVLPGFTPGRDVHHFYSPTAGDLHLSGGEAIMRPEFTKMIGGEQGVRFLNDEAKRRKRRGIHHFAGGGVYKGPLGYFRPTSGGSYGSIHDEWTGFPAVDIGVGTGTPVHAAASGRVTVSEDLETSYGHWIKLAHAGFQSLYAHLRDRLVPAGAMVRGGQLIGYSDSTGNSTGPHLHFGVAGKSVLDFMHASTNYGSAGSSIGGSGRGFLRFNPMSIFNALPIADWKKRLDGMGGWGGMFTGLVGDVAGKVKDFVSSKVGSFLGGGLGASGPVHDVVHGLAARAGWGSGAEWAALSKLITGESGWSPTAQNPSSSAYGLFQFLDSTWAGTGYHKSSDPRIQTLAGLKYIHDSYGDPVNAYGKWLSRNPHWYDNGGIMSGAGMFPKRTDRPERVLSPRQTMNFERLTSVLDKVSQGDSRGGDRVALTITNWDKGTGYMRYLARDEVGAEAEYAAMRRRMGS